MSFKPIIPKLVSPIVMWAIVLGGVLFIIGFVNNGMIFPENLFIQLLAVPAFFYWWDYVSGALRVHSEAALSVGGITKIVKWGVYAKVRHPIYSANIVLAWGIFFFYSDWRVFASALWLTVVLFFWMKLEEKYLIKKFGKGYKQYMDEVPMFIPKIFSR